MRWKCNIACVPHADRRSGTFAGHFSYLGMQTNLRQLRMVLQKLELEVAAIKLTPKGFTAPGAFLFELLAKCAPACNALQPCSSILPAARLLQGPRARAPLLNPTHAHQPGSPSAGQPPGLMAYVPCDSSSLSQHAITCFLTSHPPPWRRPCLQDQSHGGELA